MSELWANKQTNKQVVQCLGLDSWLFLTKAQRKNEVGEFFESWFWNSSFEMEMLNNKLATGQLGLRAQLCKHRKRKWFFVEWQICGGLTASRLTNEETQAQYWRGTWISWLCPWIVEAKLAIEEKKSHTFHFVREKEHSLTNLEELFKIWNLYDWSFISHEHDRATFFSMSFFDKLKNFLFFC